VRPSFRGPIRHYQSALIASGEIESESERERERESERERELGGGGDTTIKVKSRSRGAHRYSPDISAGCGFHWAQKNVDAPLKSAQTVVVLGSPSALLNYVAEYRCSAREQCNL
jgi:hypothetical protein